MARDRNILCVFACCLLGYLQTVKIEIQPICGRSLHHEDLYLRHQTRNPFHDLTFTVTVVAFVLSVRSASGAVNCALICESKMHLKKLKGIKDRDIKSPKSLP